MKNKKYLYFKILGFVFILLALILSVGVFKHLKRGPLPRPREITKLNQIEPWMTIQYVARSSGIPPFQIKNNLNLKINNYNESIEKIAKVNNIPVGQVVDLIMNIISSQKNR